MKNTTDSASPIDIPVSRRAFTPMDYDPFEGDFGAPGDKVFSDGMVNSRNTYKCCHCGGPISVGERHRSRYEKSDGEMRKFRWCHECCAAMISEMEAEEAEDEPEERFPFERRHGIAVDRARSEVENALSNALAPHNAGGKPLEKSD